MGCKFVDAAFIMTYFHTTQRPMLMMIQSGTNTLPLVLVIAVTASSFYRSQVRSWVMVTGGDVKVKTIRIVELYVRNVVLFQLYSSVQ